MTKAGIGFIVAGLAVYLVASQTQVGWLYLFDAVIWGLILTSIILPRHILKPLSIDIRVVVPPSTESLIILNGPLEDETVELVFTLRNSGRLARNFIKIVASFPFENPERQTKSFTVLSVASRSKTEFISEALCFHRGYYPKATVTVQTGGPLGLVVRRRNFELLLNLTVYPQYFSMPVLPPRGKSGMEWGQGLRSPAATEFYGSREYQYGEPLKNVHWRSTAKTGIFMLKEFEQAGQGALTVVFDSEHDFGSGRETTLEYSIKIAASLARLSGDSGLGLDIITSGQYLRDRDFFTSMDFLALHKILEVSGDVNYSALDVTGNFIVAILPLIDSPLRKRVLELAKQGYSIAVVLLEGFKNEENPSTIYNALQWQNSEIIVCAPGELEATVNRLSDILRATSENTIQGRSIQ